MSLSCVSFEGTWDHFPETVGKGRHICGKCTHSEPCWAYVGISTVAPVKGHHTCALEPNQRRAVTHVIACEAFAPRPRTVRQATLDSWGVSA